MPWVQTLCTSARRSGSLASTHGFCSSTYWLALSANQWESTLPWYKEAIIACMNPIIASTETVGLVSLPGMMTGQILGGSMPMTAIVYQIVIMGAILISRYFGFHFSILLTRKQAFDNYDRLIL